MKKNNKSAAVAIIMACCLGQPFYASAGDNGVHVDHLSVNNTLVRVTSPGKYLLLPVQESNEEARVNVLVDGKLEKSLNVRLAKGRVDFTVPLDISGYAGHDVLLDIVTPQGRSSIREAKEDACWAEFAVSDTFDTSNREKYRPLYHHTPLYGWMNDPNGMFYKDGVWYLAYQWNPYGSKWQNISWGQSTSRDLIHWNHHEKAVIEPDGLGMIFSGSAAIDHTGSAGFGKEAVLAMYTSAGASQIQSLAYSNDDAATYTTYPGNPTLTLDSEARDPNMFWNADAGEWVMVLAHPLVHEMLIFTSPDMKAWTQQSAFGKGLGAQDGVWECPDLFKLKDPVSGIEKWVLLCNLNPGGPFGGSATQYFTGSFDGKVFTPDLDASGNVATKWLDFGKDNYASVSFSDAPDGRRTIIGWMSNWQYATEVPTSQFRSANTLPRDLSLFTGEDGQVYVASNPSPEMLGLRGKTVASASFSTNSKGKSFRLPSTNSGVCEIIADIAAGTSKKVTFTLSNANGEKLVMNYDPKNNTFSCDRNEAGISDFSLEFPAVTVAPTFTAGGKVSLRIFLDTSSVEIFEKEGRFAMTNLVFPSSPYTTLTVASDEGSAKISDLKIYEIQTNN